MVNFGLWAGVVVACWMAFWTKRRKEEKQAGHGLPRRLARHKRHFVLLPASSPSYHGSTRRTTHTARMPLPTAPSFYLLWYVCRWYSGPYRHGYLYAGMHRIRHGAAPCCTLHALWRVRRSMHGCGDFQCSGRNSTCGHSGLTGCCAPSQLRVYIIPYLLLPWLGMLFSDSAHAFIH